jgi:hypothetical protein
MELAVSLIALLAAALACWSLWLSFRFKKLIGDLFRETGQAQFGEILNLHQQRLQTTHTNIKSMYQRIATLEEESQRTVGNVGLIKYNPFDSGGGNMSFSLALINGHGDGVVVTSLHSRDGMRVYSKTVHRYQSEQHLTAEETSAINQARTRATTII